MPMLLKSSDAPSQIWQTVLHELHRGALDPKHPFRYMTLATAGTHFPQVRTVVLRQLTSNLEFLVFADVRSAKLQDLQEVPRVSLLLYHPKKQVQVRVKALATIHVANDLALEHWKGISERRQSEYTGKLAPGTRIEKPELGWETNADSAHFSVLKFSPLSIEVLQLAKDGHLRIQFELASGWQGTWMVP
jgi:general stress protein 26